MGGKDPNGGTGPYGSPLSQATDLVGREPKRGLPTGLGDSIDSSDPAVVLLDEGSTGLTVSLAEMIAIACALSAIRVIGVPGEASETVVATTIGPQTILQYAQLARFYIQDRLAHNTWIAGLPGGYRK